MSNKESEITATVLIPDLGTQNILKSAQYYLDKRLKYNPDKQPAFLYRNTPVYSYGDTNNISYLFLVENKKITYFVKFQKVRYSGQKFGRQVLVIRAEPTKITAGFAQHVFFNILLPTYGTLIADKLQTEFGKNFWLNAITSAFRQNLFVYFLDRRPSPNKIIRLESMDDVDKYYDEIWGTTRGHELTFALISMNPIELESKRKAS